jgi:simple sugar transport system permease protein
MTVIFRGDHIVMGTAFNMLVMGLLPLFCKSLFETPSTTPSLAMDQRLNVWFLFALAIVFAIVIRFVLYRTRWGYHLRASGENIEATKSLGISVRATRFWAVTASGAVAALGGVFLSIAHGSQFARGMSAGRGYIALAALILSSWRPIPVILTCVLFGVADAAQILLQSFPMPWGGTLPVQFIQMFPYLVTLIVLVGLVGRIEAPSAIGKNES